MRVLDEELQVERVPQSVAFYEGKLRAAQYWIANELPRVPVLAELCVGAEASYAAMPSDGW